MNRQNNETKHIGRFAEILTDKRRRKRRDLTMCVVILGCFLGLVLLNHFN